MGIDPYMCTLSTCTYGGQLIPVLDKFDVTIEYESQSVTLLLLVVHESCWKKLVIKGSSQLE